MSKKKIIKEEISVSTLVEALLKLEKMGELIVSPVERAGTILQIKDSQGYPRGWVYKTGIVVFYGEGEEE